VAAVLAAAALFTLIGSAPNPGVNTVATKAPAVKVAKEAKVVVARATEQAGPPPVLETSGPSNFDELLSSVLLSADIPVAAAAPVVASAPPLTFQAIPKSPARNKALEVANRQIENARKKSAEVSARPAVASGSSRSAKAEGQRQVVVQMQLKNQEKKQEMFNKASVQTEVRIKQAADNKQLKAEQQTLELAQRQAAAAKVTLPQSRVQYQFKDWEAVLQYPLPTLLLAVSLAAVFVTNPLPKLPTFGYISPGVPSFKEGASDSNMEDVVSDKGMAAEENLESGNKN